jgi:DNA-binding response OmpR family regulator
MGLLSSDKPGSVALKLWRKGKTYDVVLQREPMTAMLGRQGMKLAAEGLVVPSNSSEEEIKLTGIEYKLLAYLASNHHRVLTHQSILSQVWGPEDADHTEYLRVYMRQLRKKLEEDPERPQYILTEPGIGYRFIADE